MDPSDIIRRFKYHKPDGKTMERHDSVRSGFIDFALTLNQLIGDGREKSLAMTALEEASFWTHASIAREGK